MIKTTGFFKTSHASRYLQQLCKHFGQKVAVEYSKTEGYVKFPIGEARLMADDIGLIVSFDVASPDAASTAHYIIDKHMEKFAFRENRNTMIWDPEKYS
ncbi:MAG: DUF2218 domain-containing protein [Rhizobiaceae bacterium]|nr:DUF2218 domain-containing protein [Rhizobiaceae bacterium]